MVIDNDENTKKLKEFLSKKVDIKDELSTIIYDSTFGVNKNYRQQIVEECTNICKREIKKILELYRRSNPSVYEIAEKYGIDMIK